MERPMEKPIVWWAMIVAAVAIVGGLYYWWQYTPPPPPAPPVVAAPPLAAPPPAAPAPAPAVAPIQHPVEEPAAAPPLPTLDQSDAPLHLALQDLFGIRALRDVLVPTELIHRIVATIDNLPRSRAAVELWPIKPAAGHFMVATSADPNGGERVLIGADNSARYAPYVALADAVAPARLVAVYVHFYPLFQAAYRDLGYPNGYFNDRLVETIDDLLAAPEVLAPVALVTPHAMYQYADPALEERSAGQKIMIRIGAANEARIKARLRAVRSALLHEKPQG